METPPISRTISGLLKEDLPLKHAPGNWKGLFVVLILALSALTTIPVVRVQASGSGVPVALAVRVVPSVIPADGGVYPAIYVSLLDSSGIPTLSISNLTIFLTSSTPAVGTVLNSSVVLDIGSSYAVAAFRSSPTVGSTQITASATGLASASATAATAVLRGYPASISLTSVPSEVNSTSTSTRSGTLIIEFQDQVGQPARAAVDTLVSVYSSSPRILSLNATSFTMKAGQPFKVLSFTTGFVPGSAVVTASAPQLTSGTAMVSVLGRPPLALKLYAQPNQLVTSGKGRLVIALTDLRGIPVRAPAPTLVQLRSSASTVVSVQLNVNITAGAIYTSVILSAGSARGVATVTASSSGLRSGFANIATVNARGPPVALGLFVGPNPVLADHGNYSSVVVSLINASGYSTVSTTTSYNVILTSSQNSTVGHFGPSSITSMTIPPGTNNIKWATNFTSTFVAGNTSLTASAQDLLPAVDSLSTFGPVPSKIAISSLFLAVTADGGTHPALQVSLEDSFGAPAVAPMQVPVYLISSQTGIATVGSPVTIGAGQSAVVVSVTTTSVSGIANITAYTNSLSKGYAASSTLVQTVAPSPSSIGAFAEPGALSPSPVEPRSNLILQLQDSSGNPAKARVPTSLIITSSNPSVFNQTLNVQIPQGSSYVSVPIVPLQSGSTTFTVVSPGLVTGNARLVVQQSSYAVTITASSLTIFSNETAAVTLSVSIDGMGISGAMAAWTATDGTVMPQASVTDSQGTSVVILHPSGIGVSIVTATVSSRFAPTQILSSQIIVGSPPKGGQGFFLFTFPYLYMLVGSAAAAVMLIAFLFIRRRRRASEADTTITEDASGFSFRRPDWGSRP